MATQTMETTRQKFTIRKSGIYVLLGHLETGMPQPTKEMVDRIVQRWMVRTYPAKNTPHLLFSRLCQDCRDCFEVLAKYQSRPILGMVGHWMCYGPMTRNVWKHVRRDDWKILIEHLDQSLPTSGVLVTVGVVIHNNGSRDTLWWMIHPMIPSICGSSSDDDSVGDDVEARTTNRTVQLEWEKVEDALLQENMVGNNNEPEEGKQKKITDYFG